MDDKPSYREALVCCECDGRSTANALAVEDDLVPWEAKLLGGEVVYRLDVG